MGLEAALVGSRRFSNDVAIFDGQEEEPTHREMQELLYVAHFCVDLMTHVSRSHSKKAIWIRNAKAAESFEYSLGVRGVDLERKFEISGRD